MAFPAFMFWISSVARVVLIVLVAAYRGLCDFEMVEQLLRLARVFAGDAVHAAQHVERAQRDVAEVADGSGDEVEARSEIRRER